MSEQDRVSYSYGFKVPGPEQYSSVNVSVSLSTDVKAGESPDQAMERAKAFVHTHADNEMAPSTQAPVKSELFDPANPVHRRIAEATFDALDIRSASSRTYKMNNLLKGEPVANIAAIVRKDEEDYRAQNSGRRSGGRR